MRLPSPAGAGGGPGGAATDRSSPTPVLPHLSGFLGSGSSSQPPHALGGHHPHHPPLPPKKRGGSLPASMMARLQSSSSLAAAANPSTEVQQQHAQQGGEVAAVVFLAKPLPSPLLDPPLAPSDAALPLAPPVDGGKAGGATTMPPGAAAVRGLSCLVVTTPSNHAPGPATYRPHPQIKTALQLGFPTTNLHTHISPPKNSCATP